MPNGLHDVLSVQGVAYPTSAAVVPPSTSKGLWDVLSLQGLTFPSTNVTSSAQSGFEVKDDKYTAFLKITLATFAETSAYLSLALQGGSKAVTPTQARALPGVTGEDVLTVYCELFSDNLSAGREAGLEIDFYNENGTHIGSTVSVPLVEEDIWEQKVKRIDVPSAATRMNFYVKAKCDAGETVNVWISQLKIVR